MITTDSNVTEAIRRQLALVRASAFGYVNDGGGQPEAVDLFLAIGGTIDEVIKLIDANTGVTPPHQ